MIDHILLASDFSSYSERALAYGVDLMERTGAALHFMHVREVSMGPFVEGKPSPGPDMGTIRTQYRKQCRDALAPYGIGPDDERISCVLERSATAAPTLVEYAEAQEVELIVMGTHGRRGVQRALFGSVAEEVLRTAPCPVFTTRSGIENAPTPTDTTVEQVVVPIDFSEPSRAALRYASRLGPMYDAPLTLVHAVELPSIPSVYQLEFSGLSRAEVENRVETVLRDWGRSVSADRDLSYIAERGDAVPTLLQVASTPNDLVVMATQGLSGVKRTVLGSVAEGVIRRAPGPVISARSFPER